MTQFSRLEGAGSGQSSLFEAETAVWDRFQKGAGLLLFPA